MKKFLRLVVLVAVAGFFSGCMIWDSPFIYNEVSAGPAIDNSESIYLATGKKERVDKVADFMNGEGIDVVRKYTINEEKDAGSDVGVWIYRVDKDKAFIPSSDEILEKEKLCDAQIKKIREFIKKEEE